MAPADVGIGGSFSVLAEEEIHVQDPKLLDWALGETGCPICRLIQAEVNRYSRWFFAQYYNQLATLQDLSRNWPCPGHTRELQQEGEEHQLVTIYRYLLGKEREALKQTAGQQVGEIPAQAQGARSGSLTFPQPNRGTARSAEAGSDEEPASNCPFCRVARSARDHACRLLVERIEEGQYGAAPEGSGLCLEHFYCLLPFLSPPNSRQLTVLQFEMLERLEQLLKEYERKQRHEFRHEPRGEEHTAGSRAAACLTAAWPALGKHREEPEDKRASIFRRGSNGGEKGG